MIEQVEARWWLAMYVIDLLNCLVLLFLRPSYYEVHLYIRSVRSSVVRVGAASHPQHFFVKFMGKEFQRSGGFLLHEGGEDLECEKAAE